MRLSIAKGLLVFGSVIAIGFICAIGINTLTISKVAIGSPEYKRIIDLNEVRADIQPPPLFLVEAYMLALEAEEIPSLFDENVTRLNALEQSYYERLGHWQESNIAPELKAAIKAGVQDDGARFWQLINTRMIPAIEAGDKAALDPILIELHAVYIRHREDLQKIIADTQSALAAQETAAGDMVDNYQMLAFSAALIAMAMLLVGIMVIRWRVVRPIGHMTDYMGVLAAGSYNQDVPYVERSDEIGDMAQSVEVFRQAIIDGQTARDAADMERRSREEAEAGIASRREEDDAQRRSVIEDLSTGLRSLAEGKLTVELKQPFIAEYEELRSAFNQTVKGLRETLGEVAGSTDIVQTGSTEISQAADDLSRRTEQQAAALEETAAALDEITATVRSSSVAAEEAGQMVDEAKDGTQKSGKVVQDAITAMQRIEQSSGQISQIIGVIDDIAFQTNLLALNAGVEAARAGEAGKGFAVVAQEVRELAQRSANAAKEIKELITNSVTEVGDGVSLVSETGDALQDIEQHVLRINERVAAIVTSSREQTAGLQEINTAINQMDQVTQQNAAMVEETNAACQNLTSESRKLRGLMTGFEIGNTAVMGSAMPHMPPVVKPVSKGPAVAKAGHKPVESPARGLGQKLASAFEVDTAQAVAEPQNDDWTEF
ncbi:methyl-accepting chemotaxis protein [Hoeflea prorocentri]|uniref:HAMP domain-containing methyl-accepting chemotaxis protein n=1 Tax=Hoeflea prorocentri TaxID=1922333 RepID=A0A9X3ZI12_9HYPH|nr:HAMP domain-containing methyl-accepting chemotaxis protein [Hoeflea prorocentri]MCY6382422.1 HAMP domain-containing methyl-accepting chemotaxis protein [Hoeflea prorocentri]MDA5400222.1 HAMP domain-containing methyl-accepting chemotaxis protein [Hoeflea prorocentri]